jgi:hypothetical protein
MEPSAKRLELFEKHANIRIAQLEKLQQAREIRGCGIPMASDHIVDMPSLDEVLQELAATESH